MQIDRTLGRYQLVALPFAQASVAAAQTDVQLFTQEVHGGVALDCTGYCMPWPGEIVAVSAHLTGAATVGSLTVGPTIAGAECADPTLTVTTETAKSDTARRGKTTFTKDAIVGAEITTSGDWNATTQDLVVVVWVILSLAGI